MCVCVCVRVCGHACVHACLRVCVSECVKCVRGLRVVMCLSDWQCVELTLSRPLKFRMYMYIPRPHTRIYIHKHTILHTCTCMYVFLLSIFCRRGCSLHQRAAPLTFASPRPLELMMSSKCSSPNSRQVELYIVLSVWFNTNHFGMH